jgi:hypothetical protein
VSRPNNLEKARTTFLVDQLSGHGGVDRHPEVDIALVTGRYSSVFVM